MHRASVRAGAAKEQRADDVQLSDVLIKDFMLRYLRGLTAAGKNIEYAKDGRVIVEE